MGGVNIWTVLKGMAMGIAEIIPGVSGGTIAFITGIYEKLLETINAFNLQLISEFRENGIQGVWKKINGSFLFTLLLGMVAGIVVGVLAISHLLDNYPNLVWGFFFGIILISIFVMGSQINKWGLKNIFLFVLFTLLTLWITTLNAGSGSENLLFIFGAGFIAISAFMLPGVSGSFMLLLMGMYTFIVHNHLKAAFSFEPESLLIMGVFGLGVLSGMFSFAKVLNWTFKKYRNGTLSSLTGVLLGSLYKIWPWRNPVSFINRNTGEITNQVDPNLVIDENFKLLSEKNVLPEEYYTDPQTILVIVSIIAGGLLVAAMHKYSKKASISS